jgi:HSP20 family protein
MPFEHDLDRLRSEMEELFSDLWRGRRLAGARSGFRPAADVFRTEEPPVITVVLDLAGIDPGDVELTVGGGVLTVAGVRRRPSPQEAVYHQIELDYGPFERHIPVGEEIDPDEARASYDRGLLTITLPLVRAPVRPAKVSITVVTRR